MSKLQTSVHAFGPNGVDIKFDNSKSSMAWSSRRYH